MSVSELLRNFLIGKSEGIYFKSRRYNMIRTMGKGDAVISRILES